MFAREVFQGKYPIVFFRFIKLISAGLLCSLILHSNSYALMYMYNYHYHGNALTTFSNLGQSDSQYSGTNYLSIDILSSQLQQFPLAQ